MNTISTSLLWDVFIGVTNLKEKLGERDAVEKAGSTNSIYLPVKKDKDEQETAIIDDLKEIISDCKKTKPTRSKNEIVFLLIDLCEKAVKYLSKKYPRDKWFVDENNLEDHDRENLLDDLDEYLDDLGALMYENTEIILNLEPKQNFDVDKKSLKILNKSARGDLEEGLVLLNSGHTTASYIILMRVAEFLVQQYFFKKTGRKAIGLEKSWGGMLKTIYDLGFISNVDETYGKLLDFLKDRRNEALHPGKRFDQKDCKKLISYVEELMGFV